MLHGAGSDGRKERLFELFSVERRFEILDVCLDLIMANVFERLRAIENSGVVPDRSSPSPIKIIGKFDHIAAENGGRFEVRSGRSLDKPAQTLARVAREIRLSQLAIVDDIDAALDLFLRSFSDGAAKALGKGFAVVRLAIVSG